MVLLVNLKILLGRSNIKGIRSLDCSLTKEVVQPKRRTRPLGSKSGFNPGKGNSNLGQNPCQGGPSKNKKDDKFDYLKVITNEIMGSSSLGNIPKFVVEVDKMQVQDEQPQEYVVKETASENEDGENAAKM